MSAYVCNPEHIAALAAYAAKGGANDSHAIHEWRKPNPLETARSVAEQLLLTNIAAVETRYPDCAGTDDFPGPNLTRAEMLTLADKYAQRYFFGHQFTAVEILKLCDCYDYQASELADYETSLAARQITWIRAAVIRQLPGYDTAAWEWSDPECDWQKDLKTEESRPVLLSELFNTYPR